MVEDEAAARAAAKGVMMSKSKRTRVAEAFRGVLRASMAGECDPTDEELHAMFVICRAHRLNVLAREIAIVARDRAVTSNTVTTRPPT